VAHTAYGYLALEDDDETEIERLHDLLTAHAAAEGLTLAEVIVDRNTSPGRIVRASLTVLLDAVLRAEGCRVLVPHPDALSPVPAVRRSITVEIEGLGATLSYLTDSLPASRPPRHR